MKTVKRLMLINLLLASHLYIIAQINVSEKYDLMPWPKEMLVNVQIFIIDQRFIIQVNKDQINSRVANATTKFLRRLSGRTGIFIDKGFALAADQMDKASFLINYEREGTLELNEDESYQLIVLNNQITLNAVTDIGIVRGLETMLQLSSNNEDNYFFHGMNIKDSPRFTWRGLMIDVARHYQPLSVFKTES